MNQSSSKPLAFPQQSLWLLLFLGIVVFMGPSWLGALWPAQSTGVDFMGDWISARNYLTGQPIYSPLEEGMKHHLQLRPDPSIHFPVHSPAAILVALPFAQFDYPSAVLIWNLLSLAALFLSLFLIHRELIIPLTPVTIFPLLCALLLCYPLWHQFYQGQWNLLTLLLIIGTWLALRRGRNKLAGIALGTAISISTFTVFLVLYMVLRRQGKAILACAITLLLWTSLAGVILGPQAYLDYARKSWSDLDSAKGRWNNASVLAYFHRLFDPPVVEIPGTTVVQGSESVSLATGRGANGEQSQFSRESEDLQRVIDITPLMPTDAVVDSSLLTWMGILLTGMIVIGFTAWITLRARTLDSQNQAFATCLCAMILLMPWGWEHHFVLLVLPAILLWTRTKGDWPRRALVVAFLTLLFIQPYLLWNMTLTLHRIGGKWVWSKAEPWQVLTFISLPFYALVGLHLLCAMEAFRKSSRHIIPRKLAQDILHREKLLGIEHWFEENMRSYEAVTVTKQALGNTYCSKLEDNAVLSSPSDFD